MRNSHKSMLAAMASIALADASFAQGIGPSTTTEPYLLPALTGVTTKSILTVGDAINGYRMVGIPDGAGAFAAPPFSNYFNFLMNHELGATAGIARRHGSTGAFVSRWQINPATLQVLSGRDHISRPANLFTWRNGAYVAGLSQLDRLCSADLPRQTAFFADGVGTRSRIFLSGEETSPPFGADHGRAFAHIVSGPDINKSFELPRLGKIAYENVLASPYPQAKTIVVGMDDAGRETNVTIDNVCRSQGQTGCVEPPSELFIYIGTKQATGNDIERAGLTNGKLYGVRVKVGSRTVTGEHPQFVFNTSGAPRTIARFEMHDLGDVSNKTGVQLQDDAINNKITQFIRIEDGQWDPRPGKQRDFYFVTTGRLSSSESSYRPSRLWRLRFDDIANPEAGGRIEMLVSSQFYAGAGSTPNDDPGFQMFDNMTIDKLGRIILQEDVGGNDRLGRVYVYGIDTGAMVKVAVHNAKFFSGNAQTNPNFLTNDEESSGVIDASEFLGEGWFLMTIQNHQSLPDPELVQGGQIVAVYIDPAIAR
jgi:hypothetical protein